MLKKLLYAMAALAVFVAIGLYWLITSLQSGTPTAHLQAITPTDLSYITNAVAQNRGRILMVVTSTGAYEKLGTSKSGKKIGYELTELSRAYYVFTSNGFKVDIASPKGGLPPVTIDKDDMAEFDYAFLNDKQAQAKVKNSLAITDVTANNYQAVYFIGGKGAMFDFPDNKTIKTLARDMYEADKTVAAICHGPAALVNVKLSDGRYLLENKKVSGFTNAEELFLISDAREVFPFLLEDKLRQNGGIPVTGEAYLAQVVQDGNLITGQNSWSTWKTAETMIRQLGYNPTARELSAAEHTNNVLINYHQNGFSMAKQQLVTLLENPNNILDKKLLFMHSVIAVIKWELRTSMDLVRLLLVART